MVAATASLEREDHQRDADFASAMHGKSAQVKGGVSAMLAKNNDAKKVALEEYFKHFDGKTAKSETPEERAKRQKEYATLTKQYVVSCCLWYTVTGTATTYK
jgi:sterol 24-C-methyltransferase